MKVQIRDDKLAVRLEVGPNTFFEKSVEDAVTLARDLIDAVTQCGFEVKMNVEVPRPQPTDAQIATAIARVGHIRRGLGHRNQWNDVKTNSEIVMRVLEACL